MTQIEHRTKLLRLEETNDEVTYLLTLHRTLSVWMGGALPPPLDTSRIKRVLDVGCGVGAWVHEVAQSNPHIHVFGIDNSKFWLEQAKELTRGLDNVTLLEQDMYRLEEVFDAHSFDLISVRFMVGTVSVTQFPRLLAELTRLCRRNGILILTEAELPLTSSHACDYLSSLVLTAMLRAGLAFTPAFSPQIGLMSRLRYWTRSLGYTFLQDETRYFDVSHAVPAPNLLFRQYDETARGDVTYRRYVYRRGVPLAGALASLGFYERSADASTGGGASTCGCSSSDSPSIVC